MAFGAFSTSSNEGGVATLTIPAPAGTVTGGVMVLAAWDEASPTITTPTGFTLIASNTTAAATRGGLWVWAKETTGSEPASYSVSVAAGTFTWGNGVAAFFSGRTLTGVVVGTVLDKSTSTVSWVVPGVTAPASADLCLVGGSYDWATTFTGPGDLTERADTEPWFIFSANAVSSGATGTKTLTGSAAADLGKAVLIALPAASGGSSANPADPLGISDSVTAPADRPRTQADPLGLTDTAQTTTAAVRSAADPVGLTDSLSVVSGSSITTTDPLGITDSVGLARSIVLSDNIGVTDTAGVTAGSAITDDDPVGITDNVTVALSMARSIGDQVGTTDSASADLTAPGSADLNDPLGVTDLLATTAQILRTAADSLGITDGLTVALTRAASQGDPLGITDSVTAQKGAAPNPADVVGLSDSAVAVLSRVVTIADQVAAADLVTLFNPAVPPLPTDGVSLTVSVEQRGLTLTGEARNLEVTT